MASKRHYFLAGRRVASEQHAKRAYYLRGGKTAGESARRLERAQAWCFAFHNGERNLPPPSRIAMRLLRRESPEMARLAYLEFYFKVEVDRSFEALIKDYPDKIKEIFRALRLFRRWKREAAMKMGAAGQETH